MPAAPAANVNAELCRPMLQASLERAHHRGSDPRRMPTHPHDGAERMKQKRIAESGEKLRSSVAQQDRFDNRCSEPRHPLCKPLRDAPAMQREIGRSGTLHTSIIWQYAILFTSFLHTDSILQPTTK